MTAPTFDELFRAYQPWLIRYLSTHVRHGDRALADDLAQIAFLRVWRALPTARLESDAQQRAWLGTIARHVLADHYRANATRQRLREQSIDPGDVAAFDVDEADDHADRVSTLVDIARSMAAAPADHRRVVALRLISETPWHQLAGMTRQGKAGVRRVLAEATAGVIA